MPQRGATAQLIEFDRAHYLIDCGEGTQVQLRKHGLWTAKLRAIFISHLHGDHYLGLVGLLWSMELTDRRKPLRIVGPKGLENLVKIHFEGMEADLSFSLQFTELAEGNCYADELLEVTAFEVQHRIACFGFLFAERPKMRSIIKEKVVALNLLPPQYLDLRNGLDVTLPNGKTVANTELTISPPPPLKYVFVTDTRPFQLPEVCRGANLMYHEATFLSDLHDRAQATYHSTAAEAARQALATGAKRLIIGHFSSRYTNLEPFLDEARPLFRNTHLAIDLMSFDVEESE